MSEVKIIKNNEQKVNISAFRIIFSINYKHPDGIFLVLYVNNKTILLV